MKRLWLWYFPLLFLPNLGFATSTGFGTLEFSDFLIGPYIILLLFAVKWGEKLNVGQLTPLMLIFVWWAVLSTVTIPWRYDVNTDYYVTFGLLKIAKMILYGLAGVFTVRAISTESRRQEFDWALLGAALVNGVALWSTEVGALAESDTDSGYSASNGISVMAALFLCYIGGKLVTNQGSPKWRNVAPYVLVVLVAGAAVSDGRGGWVAAFAGALYIGLRLGFRRQILKYGVLGAVVVLLLFQLQPNFRDEVEKTLFAPETTSGYQGTRNVGTLDDGARFQTWGEEAIKLHHAPVLGSGVFHRGADTGLYSTGSHNYWLQVYLETGVVGGTLVILMVRTMWKQATSSAEESPKSDVPLKAALIVAFVGGLGGEYFYGGIILFTLLSVYAPTGGQRRALPQVQSHRFDHTRHIKASKGSMVSSSAGSR